MQFTAIAEDVVANMVTSTCIKMRIAANLCIKPTIIWAR
jgi:hypothetical protein